MWSNILIFSLGACLLGTAHAQAPTQSYMQCDTDMNLVQSILTCIEAVPTYTSSYTNVAQASSLACTYAKSLLSCYSDNCDGDLPSQASALLEDISFYCGLSTSIPPTMTKTATFTTTHTATTSTKTSSGSSTITASPGSYSQSTRTSTSSTSKASVMSYSSQGKAPQGYTMYVKEVVLVAVAGLIGKLIM